MPGQRLMTSGKPPLLPRILNLQRSQLCYIVGTIYLDMPLKPNVLEDMARDVGRHEVATHVRADGLALACPACSEA